MADEQDPPGEQHEATPPPPPLKKAPVKAAKKAPAKKAPAKKASAASARKAPAKRAPAKKAPAAQLSPPAPVATPAVSNSDGDISVGAKEAAANAKTTVERAADSLTQPALVPIPQRRRAELPFAVALVISLIAMLFVRQLRCGDNDDERPAG